MAAQQREANTTVRDVWKRCHEIAARSNVLLEFKQNAPRVFEMLQEVSRNNSFEAIRT